MYFAFIRNMCNNDTQSIRKDTKELLDSCVRAEMRRLCDWENLVVDPSMDGTVSLVTPNTFKEIYRVSAAFELSDCMAEVEKVK